MISSHEFITEMISTTVTLYALCNDMDVLCDDLCVATVEVVYKNNILHLILPGFSNEEI